MRKVISAAFIAAMIVGALASTSTSANAAAPVPIEEDPPAQERKSLTGLTQDEFQDEYHRIRMEDLSDFEAANDFVHENTGGQLTVSVNGASPVSAEEAEQSYKRAEAESSSHPAPESKSAARAVIPNDAFVVTTEMFPGVSGSGVFAAGTWNWRDDFVGMDEPFDIAALQTSYPSCAQLEPGTYNASAAKWDGTETDPPQLRDAGVATGAALWNVDAQPVAFENLADNGVVSVHVWVSPCGDDEGGPVGASFTYEGNVGGSITNISVGFGFLSISYAGGSDSLQIGSEPIYENVWVGLVSTNVFYAGFPACAAAGGDGVRDGEWWIFRCKRTGTGTLVELFIQPR